MTSSPLFNSVPSGTSTLQLPSSPTVPVPVVPSGNVTVIVFPGSLPVPVTVSDPASGTFTVGASGAVPSFDTLPASSVSTAVTSSPLFNSVPSGTSTLQLPSSPTVPVPVVPSGNVTVIVFPGSSPVPVTVSAPASGTFTVGASGATVSAPTVTGTWI